MLFTIYGNLKEIHAYKGKTLIAERKCQHEELYILPILLFIFRALPCTFMKNALHLELQISQITQNRQLLANKLQ